MRTYFRATTLMALDIARSQRLSSRKRVACVAAVALRAVLGSAVVASPVAGQEGNTGSDSAAVRIVARKLESGRIEFGLQQRQADNS